MLLIELKKQRRTGALPLLPVVGLLGGAYALLNFILRREALLSLPMAPMDSLLTQLCGMLTVLNLFALTAAACLVYHAEFAAGAVKKLYTLPASAPQAYLCKFVILTILFLAALVLQNLALAGIVLAALGPEGFALRVQAGFAAYLFVTSMPVLSFMLLVSSRIGGMWVPLGLGVAGFLSAMAVVNSDAALFMVHPFVLMLKPAAAMNARPDGMTAAAAIAETLIFSCLGLWLAKRPCFA